jgi:putative SOS response-associated peptidase YedK
MCGRFVVRAIAQEEAAIRRIPAAHRRLELSDNFNITPTQTVAAIRLVDGQRELVGMRWGLIPFFAKGDPGQYSTINARLETLRTSPAYRTPWQRGQRCLILANGFYEWQVIAGGKQPWLIGCADQPTFAFAGLWDSSTPADGEPILSCTIITLPASPLMAQIHNTKYREPAILRADDHDTWLGENADTAFACLAPYPDELRSAWPVSTRVNSPRNNDPRLLERTAS